MDLRFFGTSWSIRSASWDSLCGRSSGPRTSPRDKFLDEDVLVLHQARRTSPLPIALTAVVLQGEPAVARQIGDLCPG